MVLQARGVVDSAFTQRRQSAECRERDSIVRAAYVRGRVPVVEASGNRHQLTISSSALAENAWHVFVQRDVLDLRDDQPTSLQKQLRVVPVLVGSGQFARYPIMLVQQSGVHHPESLVLGYVARLAPGYVHFPLAVRSHSMQLFVRRSVNVRTVQVRRRSVHLFPGVEVTPVHGQTWHRAQVLYARAGLLVPDLVTFRVLRSTGATDVLFARRVHRGRDVAEYQLRPYAGQAGQTLVCFRREAQVVDERRYSFRWRWEHVVSDRLPGTGDTYGGTKWRLVGIFIRVFKRKISTHYNLMYNSNKSFHSVVTHRSPMGPM